MRDRTFRFWGSRGDLACFAAAILASIVAAPMLRAQATKASNFVKVTISKPTIGPGNSRQFTVNLIIDEKCFLFANPVGQEELEAAKARLDFTLEGMPVDADIVYPPGLKVKDKLIGDYNVYRGRIAIAVTLRPPPGATAPVELAVRLLGGGSDRGF